MTYYFIETVSFEQCIVVDHHKHHTAQGPHVNGLRKWKLQYNFWRPEGGRETLHRMFTLSYFGKGTRGMNILQGGSRQLLLHDKTGQLLTYTSVIIIILQIIHLTQYGVVAEACLAWLLIRKRPH